MAFAVIGQMATVGLMKARFDEVQVAHSETRHWTISQVEVDFADLIIALDAALSNKPGGEERARRAFDIFYSRVGVIVLAVKSMLNPPEELVSDVAALEQLRDTLAERLDRTDRVQLSELNLIRTELSENRNLVSRIAHRALLYFVAEATRSREHEKTLWLKFGTIMLFLLLALGVGLIFSVFLWRAIVHKTRVLEELANTLKKTQEASLDAVLIVDRFGRIKHCNSATEDIFVRDRKHVLGLSVAQFLMPNTKKTQAGKKGSSVDMQAFEEGSSRVTAVRATGEEFPAEISAKSEIDKDGNPIWIMFVRDVSAQYVAEQKMRSAVDSAISHAAAKDRFLATMSHEMRTPLQGLIAALDLLGHSHLDPQAEDLVNIAQANSRAALEQVNNVLELTRAGVSREEPTLFNPRNTVENVMSELSALAMEKNIGLRIECQGLSDSISIVGLSQAFRRAVFNLVGNAVKYTDEGQVVVTLTLYRFGNDSALSVTVVDTGIGISKEDQGRILEPFETAATNRSGTGLGLTITKLAVDEMDGIFSIQSELGLGSRLMMTIPVEFSSAAQSDVPAEAYNPEIVKKVENNPIDLGSRCIRILIVDDNEMNLALMARMTETLGHHVTIASNAVRGLEIVESSQLDVVMMDINMPGMDGLTAVHVIREHQNNDNLYIIGITAYLEEDIERRGRNAGMDAFLLKPFTIAELKAALGKSRMGKTQYRLGHKEVSCDEHDSAMEIICAAHEILTGYFKPQRAREIIEETLLIDVSDALEALKDDDSNWRDVQTVVHKAVGSCAFAGLVDLQRLLSEVEQAGSRGLPYQHLRSDAIEIADEYLRAMAAIKENGN